MRSRRRTRVMLGIALLVLAMLVLPPLFRINRYQKELESSLSGALGRSVVFQGDISIRLLPQPALVISNFVMADDPAFGIEPMLRAETVTARLRLSSLWRGRLEIARLSFDYPSWNLVRNPQGRWNIEGLLQRTSQVQSAPTARREAQSIPRFPYIETDTGRINFKVSDSKLAHSLLDTDFALWQESENQWGLRLEGRLTRTDQNLSDTGTVRAEGSFIRSHGELLEQTPFDLRLELEDGQLGQLSSLFRGHDPGWRSNVNAQARLQGSLENLRVTADTEFRDFRRFDLASSDFMKIDVHCVSRLSKRAPYGFRADDIECVAPIAEGTVKVTGYFGINDRVQYQLRAVAQQVPMSPLVSVYRRVKAGVSEDLGGSGLVSGTFDFNHAESEQRLSTAFSGEVAGLLLVSKSLDTRFELGTVRFGSPSPLVTPGRRRIAAIAEENRLVFEPFDIDLGGKRPVSVSSSIGGSGLTVELRGEADLPKLLAAAKTFGLAQRDYNAKGNANLDVSLSGKWVGFAPPTITGTAQFKAVSLVSDGMATPLVLSSANVTLTPDLVALDRISGSWGGTPMQFEGSVRIPRTCASAACPSTFDLHATQLSLDEVNRQLNPSFRRTDWLALPRRLIGGSDKPESALFSIFADGRFTANRLTLRSLQAFKVSAQVKVHDGVIEVRELRGELLGGRHVGTWSADFTQAEPTYSGAGRIENVALSQVGTLFQENAISGTVDGTYKMRLAGAAPSALASSAEGGFEFSWKNGILRKVATGRESLSFTLWSGKAAVETGNVRLLDARMLTNAGALVTTGTVAFDRRVNLKLEGPRQRLQLTGSIEKPLVEIEYLPPGTLAAAPASNSSNAPDAKNPR